VRLESLGKYFEDRKLGIHTVKYVFNAVDNYSQGVSENGMGKESREAPHLGVISG
jgi:hypothetical protein